MTSFTPVTVNQSWTVVQAGPFVGRVSNLTGEHVIAVIANSLPAPNSSGIPIDGGVSIRLVEGETLYCRSYLSSAVVMADPGVSQAVSLPLELTTNEGGINSRVRVDAGQTGFFDGREFRSYYEMNIPAANTVNMRFSSTVDFILWSQMLNLDSGARRLVAITGANITGTWTPIPAIGRNRMSDIPQPPYEAVAGLSVGGAYTGGTEVEVLRVKTATNIGNQSSTSVGARPFDERGLPAGDYILSLKPIAGVTDDAIGVYDISWEERP